MRFSLSISTGSCLLFALMFCMFLFIGLSGQTHPILTIRSLSIDFVILINDNENRLTMINIIWTISTYQLNIFHFLISYGWFLIISSPQRPSSWHVNTSIYSCLINLCWILFDPSYSFQCWYPHGLGHPSILSHEIPLNRHVSSFKTL